MSVATHLLEEPREATAALEAALKGCPRPTYFGEYPFSTHEQREQISRYLTTNYLTPFEHRWVQWMRIHFDIATAAAVIEQLARIIDYRRATGTQPVYVERGYYYPEQHAQPSKSRP
jgi:hypothetical protein